MLIKFKADMHIHSCLSPCGDMEMTPSIIVDKAKSVGLDFIAIADHNSSENGTVIKSYADKIGFKVISGMEVTSKEEVHILAYFDDNDKLAQLQKLVYANLQGKNDEDLFGYQIVINEADEIAELNEKLLIGATELSVEEIVNKIHELGGLAIASHVDRERFSLLGQLGFVPDGLELDAMELSPLYMERVGKLEHPLSSGLPLVTSSDAHYVHEIGKTYTTYLMEEVSVSEIKKALENKDGRSVLAYS